MPGDRVHKLAMVILMQYDLPEAIIFYQKLGFRLLFHLKNKWAEMVLADLKIGLCQTSVQAEVRTGLVFQVADLLAFCQEHKGTLPFMNEPKQAPHGIMVSLQDPTGNIIDLYQPTPQKIDELISRAVSDGYCCGNRDYCGS